MPDLYQYQREGATFLAGRQAGLLCDEMGLGKTPQAIVACDLVNAKSILVLCPAVARGNWKREFERFQTLDRQIHVIASATDAQKPIVDGVVICSYDLAAKAVVRDQLLTRFNDVLVLDEVHYLKGRKTARTKSVFGPECGGIGGLAGVSARVFALTGTPAPNNPAELWPIMRALFPEAITRGGKTMSYWSFVRRYCEVQETPFGVKIVGGKNLAELKAALSTVAIRRLKKDVLPDLPPIRFETVTLTSTKSMAALIKLEEGKEGAAVKKALQDGADLKNVAVASAKLRRLTGILKSELVVDLLKNDLENGMDKVVVFAYHQDVIQRLAEGLEDFGVVRLYGGTYPDSRSKVIDKFQNDPTTRVFVGQITAAGTAITLTAASNVLFAESSWTPADNAQAAMRVHRIGQNNSVLIRFATLSGSLDEAITETVKRKTEVLAQLFD